MAAEECTATSSSSPSLHSHSWWDILHPAAANSLSSWTSSNSATWQQQQHQNPNSNSSNCDQEDVVSNISTSLNTNASNHSGLTVESSGRHHQLVDQPVPQSHNLIGEHVSDNHIWSHVLSSVGSNGDLRNSQDIGENNLFEAISSKTTSSPGLIFEPACDYLKKIDTNNWEFPNSSSVFNNFIKNINGNYTNDHHHHHQSSIESADQRFTKLSNLVSNWSIAPPDPELNNNHEHMSLNSSSSVENYSNQPSFCGMAAAMNIKTPVFLSCYGQNQNQNQNHHDVKMEDMEASNSYFRRAFKGGNNGYNHHHRESFINNSSMEADNFFGSSSMSHSLNTSSITYSGRLSKPLVDIHVPNKPYNIRPLNNNLSDCKKPAAPTSLQTRSNNGRTQGISSEGKKKRNEETSSDSTGLKKPKQETSTASSVKMHAPKVKLGDRITALQQIVSPFGKTDTASVLLEAIGYINFLQEQVQLLSNPYMKPNSHKDPWGSLDRKDQKGESKVDLRSRGLCLVPISCTPKVYHESTGSDYWTPTYRGCLYR
ncbi:hypothetical protein COLO4_16623 [Corchorus olitorius]|uniref:BHLH domain-containing protein n=1 Tax=Corchorus olitorius TaxID=93759 RepID=A0A1R3JGG2_9ROSI|nr:hypothetical protein COLO4_16623 [Corchorus olitorius]